MNAEGRDRPEVLVDASAWIAGFHRRGHDALKHKLKEALERNSVAINGLILCELLQGAKDSQEYQKMRERLLTLHYLPTPEALWERAAKLSFELRRKGLIVSTIDVIIAQTAIEHGLRLLHNDRHFDQIAEHSPLQVMALEPS